MSNRDHNHIHQCPSMETWAAYIDGSLNAADSEKISSHLEGCDRCFSEVVSLRQALNVEVNTAEKTPDALIGQARALQLAPRRHTARYLYAAAAVLVLALAGLWSTRPTDDPLAAIATAPLASLEQALGDRPFALEPPSEQALGFAEILTPEQAAFATGVALANLRLALIRDPQIEIARQHAEYLQSALQALAKDEALPTSLITLVTHLSSDHPDTRALSKILARVHADAEESARASSDQALTYLYYGKWHESLRLSVHFTQRLSLPLSTALNLSENAGFARRFGSQLNKAHSDTDLGQNLDQLAALLIRQPTAEPLIALLDKTRPR